ncbi:MAG: glycosyltransferase family 4 protein [bacterium]|nr:glycosyltransferase family 4 protein [bacterium]
MKPKKIGIEAHALNLQQGGNERYIEGLLKGLSKINKEDFSFTIFINQKAQIPDFLKDNPSFEFEIVSINPIKRFLLDLLIKVKKTKIDLLHTQYHLPIGINIPSVITLHDVSYLTHPEFFPVCERLKMKFAMMHSIRKARKVITVSQFSKSEILKMYKVADEKIYVIHNGISDEFKPSSKIEIQKTLKKFGIHSPYILSVSNLQPRKNLKGLIDSFLNVLKKDEKFPCVLVIVGRKLWLYDEIFSEIRNSQFREKIIFTGYIDNRDLVCLYSGAEMFVYISFYEGFGFPPLEAMACGCPVITSNTSSLPEVTEDAAIHVDPENLEEISSVIVHLYKSKGLKASLKEKGFRQAKKFSWDQCAERTLQVYKNIFSLL